MQGFVVAELEVQLQQLHVDREAFLLGAQRFAELIAGLGELAVAQQEIAVDGVRLSAFRMGFFQCLDQVVGAA